LGEVAKKESFADKHGKPGHPSYDPTNSVKTLNGIRCTDPNQGKSRIGLILS